jgi:hypothetical protein
MALLGYDGFDDNLASGATMLNPRIFGTGLDNGGTIWWTCSNGHTKSAGQLGGSQIVAANNADLILNNLAATTQTLFVGHRYRSFTTPGTANPNLVGFYDTATIQVGLSINASAKLIVWRGSTANILGTGTTTIVGSSYYYVEISCLVDPTVGTVEVKLNGVSEISLFTGNTRNSGVSQVNNVRLGLAQTQSTGVDDVYLCDSTGGAPLNTFLGTVRVETMWPSSADATTWTPNASTNVSRVQEANPDDDTTYNSTSTSTNVDTFNHTALSSTPATIFAVAVCSRARKDDVTNKTYRNKLKSGATTSNGATQTMATSYQFDKDIYITDPNTGVAWTQPNADATKIGYEHI